MAKRKPAFRPRQRTGKRAEHAEARPLGANGLAAILACGALATAAGLLLVDLQFRARDYSIEARRLQDMSSVRRDDVRRLEARIGFLTRDESLREAAVGPLGMIEPGVDSVQDLNVDRLRDDMFQLAARRAERRYEELLNEYESFGKEGPQ